MTTPTTLPDFTDCPSCGHSGINKNGKCDVIESGGIPCDCDNAFHKGATSDLAEQARQLVEKWSEANNAWVHPLAINDLVDRIASFTFEAATQGQVVGIEQAAKICDEEASQWAAAHGDVGAESAKECARAIRKFSLDPSLLDRVRSEAATVRDSDWLKWLKDKLDCDSREETEHDFNAMAQSYAYLKNTLLPKRVTEAATTALEQAAQAVCFRCRNKAAYHPAELVDGDWQHRDQGDSAFKCQGAAIRLLKIAAIGDDRGQQR